jgi:hypothetical protein
MSQLFLYADEASCKVLLDERQKFVLIGGDFGYGNFGDVAQHINSINIARQAKRFATVSVMAANAIGFREFPEWATRNYGTDAIIFVADYPLILDETYPALVPLLEIRNLSVVHLYGGGFLNERWGDFVLGLTEYFLTLAPHAKYLVSGQQITHPYQTRVAKHVKAYKPAVFGVRDGLSRHWLRDIDFDPMYSFDDATEALVELTQRLPLKRGPGLLMHLNTSDYIGRGTAVKSLHNDLMQLSEHTGKSANVTLFQAFRDVRYEVNDSTEALKQLDFQFPFKDIRLVEVPALVYDDKAQLVIESIQGELGYSCSYHIALWLQLAGIPCWLPSDNPFYDQKTKALQVTQDLVAFLEEPSLADHRTNLDKRAQWRVFFDQALESAAEVREVSRVVPIVNGPNPWPFFFKGKPSIDERLQSEREQVRQLAERIEGLSAQLTEVGHEAHTQRQRAEGAEARLQVAEHEKVKLAESVVQMVQSRSWRITRPMRAVVRFAAHGHFDSKGQVGVFGAVRRVGRVVPMRASWRKKIGELISKISSRLKCNL